MPFFVGIPGVAELIVANNTIHYEIYLPKILMHFRWHPNCKSFNFRTNNSDSIPDKMNFLMYISYL